MSSSHNILITGADRGIGLGLLRHYVAQRASVIATSRRTEPSSELAELLELAQLLQSYGVSEMDVGSGRIHAQFDAQGPAQLEFLKQFLFGEHLGGTRGQHGKLFFGRHGEIAWGRMMPS